MNTDKLYKDLINSEELKDVPIKYIFTVAVTVLKLIQGNNYVYKIGE